MLSQLRYTVSGEEKMHCAGCETRIQNALKRLDGVYEVQASTDEQEIALSINTDKVGADQIEQRLEQLGYQVQRR